MKITYDKESDAAYIYFVDKIENGEVEETYLLDEFFDLKGMVNLDVDKDGRLLGLEVLNAKHQLPGKVIGAAEVIG